MAIDGKELCCTFFEGRDTVEFHKLGMEGSILTLLKQLVFLTVSGVIGEDNTVKEESDHI